MQLPSPVGRNPSVPVPSTPIIAVVSPFMDSPIYSSPPAIGDFVNDDTQAFIDCIERLRALGGGSMWLPRPLVRWRVSRRLQLYDNIWVLQDGSASEIRQVTPETQIFYANGATNVRIDGVNLRGAGGWSNAWVDDAHYDRGVDFANCSNVRVTRAQFLNFALASAWFQSCSDTEVYNCKSRGPGAFGTAFVQGDVHNYSFVFATNDLVTPSTDIAICSCDEISNSAFGPNVTLYERVKLNNNTIKTIPAQHGFYLGGSGMEVCDNVVEDFALIGIKIFFTANTVQRDVLVGPNEIRSGRHNANVGIQVAKGGVGATCKDIHLVGNIIRNTHATPLLDGLSRGIDITDASSVSAVGNRIGYVFQHGVLLGGAVDDLLMSDLHITSPALHGILSLGALTNAKFSGVKLFNGTVNGNGFYFSAGGDNIDVNDATVEGAFTYALANIGATRVRARGNTLAGYTTDAVNSNVPFQFYGSDNIDGKETTSYAVAGNVNVYDRFMKLNGAGGAFNMTLPDATKMRGQRYSIIKTDATANAVGLAGSGGQTINGVATKTTAVQWAVISVVSDGVNWVSAA